MISAEERWEKWINACDDARIEWAVGFLSEKAQLQIRPSYAHMDPSGSKSKQLKNQLLAAIKASDIRFDTGWIHRLDNAWRQVQHRKKLTARNRKLSLYSLSEKAKKQLRNIATNQGLTVHEALEKIINEAAQRGKHPDKAMQQLYELAAKNTPLLEKYAVKSTYTPSHSYFAPAISSQESRYHLYTDIQDQTTQDPAEKNEPDET